MRRIKNIKLKEMKRKPINTTLLATVTLLAFCAVSCDEFPPVKYDDPEPYEVYSDEDFSDCTLVTVKDLKDMYKSSPVNITDNIYIKAQVISSDQSGNLYRTMYLQDATAGIELKIGTRNLYNDYKLGQTRLPISRTSTLSTRISSEARWTSLWSRCCWSPMEISGTRAISGNM